MCIALLLCCRLHPVPRVSSRCPFRVPELRHVSMTSRRPTLLFGRLTLPVCREVVVCVVVLLCATRLSNLVSFGLRCFSIRCPCGSEVPSLRVPETHPTAVC